MNNKLTAELVRIIGRKDKEDSSLRERIASLYERINEINTAFDNL
jgi:hypothetical protein